MTEVSAGTVILMLALCRVWTIGPNKGDGCMGLHLAASKKDPTLLRSTKVKIEPLIIYSKTFNDVTASRGGHTVLDVLFLYTPVSSFTTALLSGSK